MTDIDDETSQESKFRKNSIIIALFVGFIIYAIIILFSLFNPTNVILNVWQDYEKYLKPLTDAIPLLIAAITILSVFYLGKFHDYRRDLIKQYGVFTEIKIRIERKYSSTEIERHEKLIKAMEDDDIYHNESEVSFKGTPKWAILNSFCVLGALILSFIFIRTDSLSGNELFSIFISIIFGIIEFFIMLGVYEYVISKHDKALKNITQNIAYMKAYLD